ncbi:MAG: hypothetical protein JW864_15685 [Spirochaetes bacterium]|nr:hypothetical protein [Spirochaetota bacterium]
MPGKNKENTGGSSSIRNSAEKKRSLPVRIFIKFIKILFIWIPLSVISLIAVLLIFLKLYLTPGRVEGLAVSNFSKLSNGSLALKVNDFSIYSGFEIQNIVIRNGEEFNRTGFVEIERIVLRYNLFSMLTGNLHLKEIGIYKPKIFLKEKNGIWNFARLMKPGSGKVEEAKPEEKASSSDEINLPISVDFFLNFMLENLQVFVDGESFDTSMKGLTYNMNVYIPPFRRVPLSMEAVSLLEQMRIELNPQGEMDVSFSNKDAGLITPLTLTWKLIFDKSNKTPLFGSGFRFGTHKAPVRFRQSYLAPLDFMVSYDIVYFPKEDFLKVNDFGLSFHGNKWFNITGGVQDVTKDQKFNIRMTESRIVLSDLYPYFVNFTGNRSIKFGGVISLFPLMLKGDLSSADINGMVNLKNITFKNPDVDVNIPELNFLYKVRKRNDDMKISASIDSRHIIAAIGRDKLGDNGISLDLDVYAKKNFSYIGINNLAFKLFNPLTNRNALNLKLAGNTDLKNLAGKIRISRLTFVKENLSGGIKNKFLADVPLSKPVDVSLDLGFSLGKDIARATIGMLVKVQDYDIKDLLINADILQNYPERRIQINQFDIAAKSFGLSFAAGGFLETKSSPFSDSDLKLSLRLDRPELKPVYGPWEISGSVQLDADMKGGPESGRASGNFMTNDLFVHNAESMLAVEDMNMNFPFEYSFASGPVESRIAVNKAQLIDNENFMVMENFTIKSIKAKHPARNIQYEYVSDFASSMFFKNNAFEISKMRMYVMDGAVYGRDILFYLADMPATGSYKNIEYRLILDVTNVDIGKLDDPDPGKKTREAELSLNANFAGKGLDMFLGKGKDRSKELNVKGFININKIGEKFAKKLMEAMNDEKGKSKIGALAQFVLDNSGVIKGFKYNLNIGLMDVEVNLDRKAIGYGIFIEDIERRRIPIQEYLNNIFGRN